MTQGRSGQRKSRTEIASLARGYTETVLKMLAGLVTREDVAPAARIAAGTALLDRGWGKPTQSINLHDERPPVTEIFNRIVYPEDPDRLEFVREHVGPNGLEVIVLVPAPADQQLAPLSLPAPKPEPESEGEPQPTTPVDHDKS
jgi:hypothetical protein